MFRGDRVPISECAVLAAVSPWTLLIISDQAAVCDLIRSSVLDTATVQTARTFAEVLADVQYRQPPDVILLDVEVGDLSIERMCRRLRAVYPAQRVPIILLVPHHLLSAGIAGLQSGANDYLISPCTTTEVLARIQVQLHLRQVNHDDLLPHTLAYMHTATPAGELPGINQALQALMAERQRVETEHARLLTNLEQQTVALRDNQAMMRSFMENAIGLLFVRDTAGRFVLVNQHYAAFFGLPPDQIIGKTPADLFDPAFAAKLLENDRQIMATGQPIRDEDLLPGVDGMRTYLSVFFPLYNAQGQINAIGGISADITARKRLEEHLRAREEQFRSFFERAPVAIGVARDSVLLTVNPAYLGMFGYDNVAEVAGTLVLHHIAPHDRVTVVERIMRQAQGEDVESQFTLTGLRKDGSTFPMLYNAVPVVLDDGQEAITFFVVDMSDLKRAEEERDQFFSLSRDMLCIAGTDGYFKRLNPAWEATLGLTIEDLLAEPYLAFVHPEDRDVTRSIALAGAAWPHQTSFENRYRCKDGGYRWLSWSFTLIPEQQLFYGLARDITEQKRAEREQQRLYRVAEGLRDVLAVINSDRSLRDILHCIVEQATHLQNADAGLIYRCLHPSDKRMADTLRVEAVQGFAADYVGLLIDDVIQTICYTAIQTRAPVVLSNATSLLDDLLASPTLGADYRRLVTEIRQRFRSTLVVPLIIKGEVYGTIALYDARERHFREEEINLSVAFAVQSALAIENARLRQQVHQAAVREERSRLARELHDSVSQSLYSLTLLAEGWRLQAHDEHLEHIESHFARLGDIANQCLREMRLLIYQLRIPVLEKEGLIGAIQRRLESVERRSGVIGRLVVENEVELPTPLEEQLYRIIQEALNNALKHAEASEVTVRLRQSAFDTGESAVEVEITDNGCGFEPASVLSGMGMQSMHERAEQSGGSLTILSRPGQGTRVRLKVRQCRTDGRRQTMGDSRDEG